MLGEDNYGALCCCGRCCLRVWLRDMQEQIRGPKSANKGSRFWTPYFVYVAARYAVADASIGGYELRGGRQVDDLKSIAKNTCWVLGRFLGGKLDTHLRCEMKDFVLVLSAQKPGTVRCPTAAVCGLARRNGKIQETRTGAQSRKASNGS